MADFSQFVEDPIFRFLIGLGVLAATTFAAWKATTSKADKISLPPNETRFFFGGPLDTAISVLNEVRGSINRCERSLNEVHDDVREALHTVKEIRRDQENRQRASEAMMRELEGIRGRLPPA